MAAKIGLDCKFYRNTGSYGSPTWNEITHARDVTANVEPGDADLSIRSSDWKIHRPTLKDLSFEFEMLYDPTIDDFTVLQAACFNRTPVDLWAADGDSATTGSQGIRAVCYIYGFSRSEPMEQGVMVKVTAKPGDTTNPPSWYVAP